MHMLPLHVCTHVNMKVRAFECITMTQQAMSYVYLGYMHQSKWCEHGKCTFMLMSPCKQYLHQQEILMYMSVMHILTLWS